jgi:cytochrome P450
MARVGSDKCPVDHTLYSCQKTAHAVEPVGRPIERDGQGVWHIRSYDLARLVLRESETRQAGFKADLLERMPKTMSTPVLYQEGKEHQEQRKQTARFFTPMATSANYRQLMESLTGQLVGQLERDGRADLAEMSMTLAVQVASKVVGLTNSRKPGIDRRINAFFSSEATSLIWSPRGLLNLGKNQWHVLQFYYQDVQPAIQARRRQQQEDVISYLLDKGYRDREILTECVTYAAAGMATTREFICVAAWHFLEQPELRRRYLAANEEERHTILHEILRLEPVVGHLFRRATEEIVLDTADRVVTIPKGALIDIHTYAINAEEAVVGEAPLQLCPERVINAPRAHRAVLSFGDGHHRCPGAYVAIQESDIFLQRLLAFPGLRVESGPELAYAEIVAGYELRNFIVALDN